MRKHYPRQWYIQWRNGLAAILKTADNQLRKVQTRYKRYFDAHRRRIKDKISHGDSIFVDATLRDQPHKLALITMGSFPVAAVDTHTEAI